MIALINFLGEILPKFNFLKYDFDLYKRFSMENLAQILLDFEIKIKIQMTIFL